MEAPKLKRSFYAIIPEADPAHLRILMSSKARAEGEVWGLPSHEPENGFFPVVGPFNKGLEDLLGIKVIALRCIKRDIDLDVKGQLDAIYEMENRSPGWAPTLPLRWVGVEELRHLNLEIEDQRPVIESWLAEAANGVVPPRRVPWAIAGWYDAATEWIRVRLEERGVKLLGSPRQIKQWGISCILCADTDSGDFYLKAAFSLFAHEPSVTRTLAQLYAGQVPDPIATLVEPEQGWMLLSDFGGSDLEDAGLEQLESMVRLYASMQIRCVGHGEELLAQGFADRRLSVLERQIDGLLADMRGLEGLTDSERETLRESVPSIKSLCARLASYGVPETLLHGDFHTGNIIKRDNNYLVFDWTDACVAHPFLDLAVILYSDSNTTLTQQERDQLRDVYLRQWTEYASIEQLWEASKIAMVLGALHQAISYQHITDSLEEAAEWEFKGNSGHWLRIMLVALNTL